MNPNYALDLLIQKLSEHGLTSRGWTGGLDHSEHRFGVCRPSQREISLSRILVANNSEEEVLDTILHEIAHALAAIETGENCGHDERWKAICRRIGARPERCYDSEEVNTPEAPWVLAHRETGEVFSPCQTRPKGDLSQVFIRGRKEETLGQLELKANPAFSALPITFFNRPNSLYLQQRIIEALAPLSEELGIDIQPSAATFQTEQAEISLSLQLPPQGGLSAEQHEFNQLASAYGLTEADYGKTLNFQGQAFHLIGFKPRNRKYPVIVENAAGTRYKLPLAALDQISR